MIYAKRTEKMKASEIREILKITEQPEIISFGGGMPSSDSFPLKAVINLTQRVLKKHGKQALQYGTTEGLESLRKSLTKRMKRRGVKCKKDEVLITTGSQQALDLTAKIFINPGDYIAVEMPTYLGALTAFNAYQPRYLTINMNAEGMITYELEKKLSDCKRQKKKVKFIYTIPTFQNPTGVSMNLERRKHLLEIAEKFNVPILEDDAYFELKYSGKRLPTLKSLDKNGLVIYTSTFSKILSPGFRLAWVVAREDIIRKLVIAKQGADLCSNVFCQYIADEYIRSGLMDKQIPKIRKMYKRKRDIMLKALEKYFPKGVKWTKPNGGLFIWVILPEYFDTKDTQDMFEVAIKEKVAFVHGAAFFADRAGHKNTMRLNFSNTDDKKIEIGIKRLAKIIKERMK